MIVPLLGKAAVLDAASVYSAAKDAVVTVRTDVASGTGFVIGDGTLVLTCLHVLNNSTIVRVDETGRSAVQLLGGRRDCDVALLKLSRPLRHRLRLNAGSTPSPGTKVYAIGTALGFLDHSISEGIVSGKRSVGDTAYLQITAPVSHGNSGGPILDARGLVVGMTDFNIPGGQSLNFAISAYTLNRAVRRINADAAAADSLFADVVRKGSAAKRSSIGKPRTRFVLRSVTPAKKATPPESTRPAEPIVEPKSTDATATPAEIAPPPPRPPEGDAELVSYFGKLYSEIVVARDRWNWALIFNAAHSPRKAIEDVGKLRDRLQAVASIGLLRETVEKHAGPQSFVPQGEERLEASLGSLARLATERYDVESRIVALREIGDAQGASALREDDNAQRNRLNAAIEGVLSLKCLARRVGQAVAATALTDEFYAVTLLNQHTAVIDLDIPAPVVIRLALSGDSLRANDRIVGVAPASSPLVPFAPVASLSDLKAIMAPYLAVRASETFRIQVRRGDETVTITH